jgi:choline dehydrogenase-like flavoprotein
MVEEENFGAIVIGSGFGGTIAALTLSNYFSDRVANANDRIKQVCLLERGQWWISHELPYRTQDERDREKSTDPNSSKPNMREFLVDGQYPVGYWAHPDNSKGLIDLALKDRLFSKKGLYDYRPLADGVHAIVASGVGGGSLVYSNVTLAPPEEVYQKWATQDYGKPKNLENYFDPARAFIGVDKITTLAGLGTKNAKLDKSRIFQEAADKLRNSPSKIVSNPPNSIHPEDPTPDPDLGFGLDLAITDVQDQPINGIKVSKTGHFEPSPPESVGEVLRDQNQQNVCQRQGRCVLGCLPGARHTLNKKLVKALQNKDTKDILTVRALCEAETIEIKEPGLYRVHYNQYGSDGKLVSQRSVTAKILVVAAGTLGSTELLLRSRDKLNLSELVGEGFSTDGDLLGFTILSGKGHVKQVDNTRGPINTCHALFAPEGKFAYSIEDTTIPKMVAPLFATMLEIFAATRHIGPWKRLRHGLSLIRHFGFLGLAIMIFGFDIPRLQGMISGLLNTPRVTALIEQSAGSSDSNNPESSVANTELGGIAAQVLDLFTKDLENPLASPEERLSRFFIFSCMGIDNAKGVLKLRQKGEESEDNPSEPLKLNYSLEENRQVFEKIIDGMNMLAKAIDPSASPAYSPYWTPSGGASADLFSLHPLGGVHGHRHRKKAARDRSLFVLHPLGGCAMGRSSAEGVVNSFGQVWDHKSSKGLHENLYVLDGSIVPGALGVNSSLTIAALALRGVENLVEALENKALKQLPKFNPKDYWPDSGLIQQLSLLRKRQSPSPQPPIEKTPVVIEA